MPDWLSSPGTPVPLPLQIPRAYAVAKCAASGLPYVSLVDCRRTLAGKEVVTIEVEVERGQHLIYDIARIERLAIVFDIADDSVPEVLALRIDFPQVPHLNLRADLFPRSLCLYEEPWDEVRLSWSPAGFIDRIRRWLTLTAAGRLHATDQYLEPIILGNARKLIISPALLVAEESLISIRAISISHHGNVLTAERADLSANSTNGIECVALVVHGMPQVHGIIQSTPRTIKELAGLLAQAGINLLDVLRDRLKTWLGMSHVVLGFRLVIVAHLPKARSEGEAAETTEIWAFDSLTTIREIGQDVGIFGPNPDGTVGVLIKPDNQRDGQDSGLGVLNPLVPFDPHYGAILNNSEPNVEPMVCVGVGALGSQIITNLARTGYGKWTLLDHDQLLPHNLARHALLGDSVGQAKAPALAARLNTMFGAGGQIIGVDVDVLNPGREADATAKVFEESSLILDVSTSIAVARHLASGDTAKARRMSAFVNPTGTDLVLLAEDRDRQTTLDWLEMVYYRFVGAQEGWDNHLKPIPGRLRYARSCRDVTSRVPQELLALHAAIASRSVRRVAQFDGPEISVWRADPATLTVERTVIPAAYPLQARFGGWTLKTDAQFLDRVERMRQERLPNETGGVIIGAVDTSRQILYVVDFVPSPPDSKEWPTVYIRGCAGLADTVEAISARTAGMLQYLGEWHSHPAGCSSRPSGDDQEAFEWLRSIMAPAGIPPIMLIAGDEKAFYIDTM